MVSRRDVLEQIDGLFSLSDLIKTYEEIAASRMQRTRSFVLQNRTFLFDLGGVYQQVRSSYRTQLMALMQKRKIKDKSKMSLIKRNGKTVIVYVSANTRLYGDLMQKNLAVVKAELAKGPADLVVIGRLGMQLLEGEDIPVKPTFFDFPDQTVDSAQASVIAKHILQYEQILVVYGQFVNVVSQESTVTNLSGKSVDENVKGVPTQKYIFEPSLEKIMTYFETEIFASIFEQVMQESQLAKNAARMINLDLATENIDIKVLELEREERKLKHLLENKKQLNAYSSILLWKGR